MKLYSTVSNEASAEQIIERSRFITYVKPVASKEEADELFVKDVNDENSVYGRKKKIKYFRRYSL